MTLNVLPKLDGPPPLTQTVLPEVLPFEIPSALSAYRLVLTAEKDAVLRYVQVQAKAKAEKDVAAHNVLSSRVVGFLFSALWNMKHVLGHTPINRLTTEVVSATGNNEIYDLGTMYIDHLICSFRTTTPPIPPSNHPSRPSMDHLEDMLIDALQSSGSDHRSARTRALARDGYSCMITNTIDAGSFEQHPAVKKLRSETGAAVHDVQTCHIFNESILQNINMSDEYPHQPRRQNAGTALGILKMFELTSLVDDLMTIDPNDAASASGVHNLRNILSLVTPLHRAFDQLKLAFEPVDGEPNTYDIVFAYPERALGFWGLKSRVTLVDLAQKKQVKQAELPLPDPSLLALHAVCARVAHMSGAARALDEFDWDVEETSVLSPDGASAHLLDMMLSPLVPTAHQAVDHRLDAVQEFQDVKPFEGQKDTLRR